MTLNKGLFSSQSGEWETPHDLFDQLWEEFGGFDTDPCCEYPGHYTANRVLANFGTIYSLNGSFNQDGWYGPEDGLTASWHGKVYMNPPYGREIGKWVTKAWSEVVSGNAELVVALLPARTDTKWWQLNILERVWFDALSRANGAWMHATEIRFLPGRLKFVGAKGPAPFPSAIVVWRR